MNVFFGTGQEGFSQWDEYPQPVAAQPKHFAGQLGHLPLFKGAPKWLLSELYRLLCPYVLSGLTVNSKSEGFIIMLELSMAVFHELHNWIQSYLRNNIKNMQKKRKYLFDIANS